MSPAGRLSLFPTIESYPKVTPVPPHTARSSSKARIHGTRSDSTSSQQSNSELDEGQTIRRPESRERRVVAIPAPTINVSATTIPETSEQDEVSSLHSFSSSPPRGRPRLSQIHSAPSTSRSSMTLIANECPSRTGTIRHKASNEDTASVITSTSTLVGTGEESSTKTKGRPAPIRSMFPEYDQDLSLREQYYFPTQISPRNLPWEQVAKQPYSPEFGAAPYSDADEALADKALFQAMDDSSASDLAFTPEYELLKLWNLMEGAQLNASTPRIFKLKLHRRGPPTKAELKMRNSKRRGAKVEQLLSFGPSHARALLTVSTDTEDIETDNNGQPQTRISLTRRDPTFLYHPGTQLQDITVPVSDLCVTSKFAPSSSSAEKAAQQGDEKQLTTFTPHSAIVSALSAAAASPEGAQLASIDPMANTSASARLARSAMAKARAQHGSQLVYTTASGGSHTGRWSYALRSTRMGLLPIEIDGDVRLDTAAAATTTASGGGGGGGAGASTVHPGSIKLMTPPSPPPHKRSFSPSSSVGSQGSTSRGSRELASLSLATSTLTIHVGALSQLNVPLASAIDTSITTLISVLMSETYTPRVSTLLSFLPPPKSMSTKKGGFGRRLRKSKSVSNDLNASEEGKLEQGMSAAFGSVAFLLGVAVDSLTGVVESVERKRQVSSSTASASASASASTPALAPPPQSSFPQSHAHTHDVSPPPSQQGLFASFKATAASAY